MTIYALVSELSEVRLWGLDADQRLRRQLNELSKEHQGDFTEINWLDADSEAPEAGQI